jgi:MFS family permease
LRKLVSHPLQTRWLAVFFIFLCGMTGIAHIFKFSPAMPFIRHDLALGLVAGGWMFSIVNVIAMTSGIAAGTLCDMVGRRRTLFIGLVLMGLGSLLGSFAASGGLMIAARITEGVGLLALVIAAPVLISAEVSVRDRNLAFGLWGSYHPAGAGLTFLLVPLMLEGLGWRMVWQVMAGVSFVMAALLLFYRPQLPDRHGIDGKLITHTFRSLKQTLAVPGPRLMALAFGLYTFCFVPVMAWLPSYMIEHRGISVVVAGSLTAAVIASNIIGNLAAGVFLHRGMKHSHVMLMAALLMAAMVLVIFSGGLPDGLRYGGCLVYSIFGGILPTVIFASAPLVSPTPAHLGATNGLIVQGSNTGSVIGPPVIAAVAASAGAWEPVRWPLLAALGLLVFVITRISRIELEKHQ